MTSIFSGLSYYQKFFSLSFYQKFYEESNPNPQSILIIGGLALATFAVAYKYQANNKYKLNKDKDLVSKAGPLQFTKCEQEIRHFRQYSEILQSNDQLLNKSGIQKLRLSGSGQFGAEHIPLIVNRLKGNYVDDQLPVWFMDLRAERHCFVNGKPAVWKRENEKDGETSLEVANHEDQLIYQIANKRFAIKEREGNEIQVSAQVESEKTLIESNGYNYIRFPIVEHHCPTDACVDSIVEFMQQHPQAHLHMHCYVTERTTLVLAMADMLHNAQEIPLDDIVYRAKAMGGSDLMKIPKAESKNYSYAPERIEFLKQFYTYCQQENPLVNRNAKTWTAWRESSL